MDLIYQTNLSFVGLTAYLLVYLVVVEVLKVFASDLHVYLIGLPHLVFGCAWDLVPKAVNSPTILGLV